MPANDDRRDPKSRRTLIKTISVTAAAITALALGACSTTTTPATSTAASTGPSGGPGTLTGAGSTYVAPFLALALAERRPGSWHGDHEVVLRRRTGRRGRPDPAVGMTRARQAVAGLVLAVLAAGCGSSASRPAAAAPSAPAPAPLSLATALTSAGTTWATIPMGAPSGPNQFWQLFTLTGSDGRWTLHTPPGIATNGALVLTGPGRQTLITGIRPSLDLGFSSVTTTRDGGGSWSSLPPEPGFADVPDALAATADGRLIALDQDQAVQAAASRQANWTALTTTKTLAGTDAAAHWPGSPRSPIPRPGRRCWPGSAAGRARPACSPARAERGSWPGRSCPPP